MTYQQLVAEAMVKLGEGDAAGAEVSYHAAIAAAQAVDPQGPRHAEALNYLAQFLSYQGRQTESEQAAARAAQMAVNFPQFG